MSQIRKLGVRATTHTMRDNVLRVTYHNTDVVTALADRVELRTGGYRTNTTKTRMNQAANQFGLGYMVYQKNFHWFVRTKAGDLHITGNFIAFNRETGELIHN